MTKPADTTEKSMTAEYAMNTVLEAEQKAKQKVEECKAEAEVCLQQARRQAQQIAERVDNRITRIHQRCNRAITDQVKQLKTTQEKSARDNEHSNLHLEAIDEVVEVMAKRLTTPDQKTPDNSD